MSLGAAMLFVYLAAILGIYRFRFREYWKWFGFLFAWMLTAGWLFNASGTLEDSTGDGFITRQIRIMTNDGPSIALYAVFIIALTYGVMIWMLRTMYVVGKQAETEQRLQDQEAVKSVSSYRKLGEAALATIVGAGYIALIIMQSQQSAHADPGSVASAQGTDSTADTVSDALSQTAAELNRSTPKSIDEITTLSRVSVDGRTLTYHYNISRRDTTEQQLRSFVSQKVVRDACKNSLMRKDIDELDVTYRYSYTLLNIELPVVVEVNSEICAALN